MAPTNATSAANAYPIGKTQNNPFMFKSTRTVC